MLQPLIHGLLLALGLILPLGAQNVFVFNQGANQKKISKALPVIITAGLCDTFLIVIAILGVSLILISMPTKKQILFALSVSLLNPHAIMDTVGVIGTSASVYDGYDKVVFSLATISVSWIWFVFLAILGRITGKIDKSGKYIVILNKVSSVIVIIVGLIILKNIVGILS
ncbi:LysE/ArgO family amino acid transporter [Staphylococcus epidermidis]